jgi:hypothetical protein
MKHFTPQHKHSILLEYIPYSRTHGFQSLANRHGVAGGKHTLLEWYSRWDGTAASLEEKRSPGRPRILTTQEVQRHVATRIRAANRSSKRIHYTDIHQAVERETHQTLSLRTLRRYGEEDLGAKQHRGNKRTRDECKHSYI